MSVPAHPQADELPLGYGKSGWLKPPPSGSVPIGWELELGELALSIFLGGSELGEEYASRMLPLLCGLDPPGAAGLHKKILTHEASRSNACMPFV